MAEQRVSAKNPPYFRRVFCWSLQLKGPQAVQVDFFRGLLNRLGLDDARIAQETIAEKVKLSVFFDKISDAKKFDTLFKTLGFKSVARGIKILHKDDWLTRWKDDWKPFVLTPGIDVVPVAHKEAYRARGRRPIFLDTVMSFGTGLHETTRFTAGFIAEHKNKYISFLDIGTGTGILALVALKCGFSDVCAVDVEAMSVEAAKINYRANGHAVKNIYRADVKTFKLPQQFDCVAANLITQDLIALRRKILNFVRPGGILVVSGISLERLALLRRSFKDLPLRCVKIKKGRQWAAVLYRRNM